MSFSSDLVLSTEIMQAAGQNSSHLADLLQRLRHGDVEEGTYDRGLALSARKGYIEAAGMFIDKGAIHYVSTFKEAIQHRHYEVATLLLLCACVCTGDISGLQQVFGHAHEPDIEQYRQRSRAISALSLIQDNPHHQSQLSALSLALCEPHRSEICRVLREGNIRTVHIVRVALRSQQMDAALIVLIHACCDQSHRRADWSRLGLPRLEPGWLRAISEWTSRMDLSGNTLTVVG